MDRGDSANLWPERLSAGWDGTVRIGQKTRYTSAFGLERAPAHPLDPAPDQVPAQIRLGRDARERGGRRVGVARAVSAAPRRRPPRRTPPTAVATTGVPAANASSSTWGMPSVQEMCRNALTLR